MGAAAENRYQAFAGREAAKHDLTNNEHFVRHLNSLPKLPNAGSPFGRVNFISSRGGWVVECPETGFGYWHKSIREAVRSWRVAIFADGASLFGVPA